jgi:hypothetical protein
MSLKNRVDAFPDILSSLGSERILYFPDRVDDWVDSAGGFKHPTNLHIVNCNEDN